MPKLRWWHAGVGVVVIGTVGGVAWWSSNDTEPAPTPPKVECDGPGIGDVENNHEGRPNLPQAAEAARTRPEPRTDPVPRQHVDYVRPLRETSGSQLGFRLDEDAGTVDGVLFGLSGTDGSPSWRLDVSDEPLLGSTVTGFPGHHDLVVVNGRQRDSSVFVLSVLDEDGVRYLDCTTRGVPEGSARGLPTVTADGSLLLVPVLTEDERPWLVAHSTDDGEHLWSVPGTSYTADEDHVFVADQGSIAAYDPESGEQEWEQEPVLGFEDRPYTSGVSDNDPNTWSLTAVDDELYVHGPGADRVVTLATSNGDLRWDLVPGDGSSTLSTTLLDRDGTVLLDFGDNQAIRRASGSDREWLHQSTTPGRVSEVMTHPEESSLIVIRSTDPHNSWVSVYTGSGDQLFARNLPTDSSVAIADTVAYVLDESRSVVSGYDLETGKRLWRASVPVQGDTKIHGIAAVDGGFGIFLGRSEVLRFSVPAD